jgi:putative endopeptidase
VLLLILKNKIMVRPLISTLIVLLMVLNFSCKPKIHETPDVLVSHIDSTVKPGSDFFDYANGKWFKENPIPPSEQYNGLWLIIQDTIKSQIFTLCKTSAELTNTVHGSNKQKIGDFYFSGMDSLALNKNGIADLKNDLSNIDQIKDYKDIVKAVAYIQIVSGSPMFSFGVGPDDKISSKNAVFIYQGGLSLPDRSFYFDNDSRSQQIRTKFVKHIEKVFTILGYKDEKATQVSRNFMKLETAIAKSSRKREDLRNPLKNYNKITFKALVELTPNFDWTLFMNEVGLPKVDSVIVGQPEFLTDLNAYIKSYTLGEWKDYLKYHLLHDLSRYMDDSTYNEFFDFYSKTLRGVEEPKPRWKRVVEQTDYSLGELIGQVYVDEYLPKNTKEKLMEIGDAIKSEYAERIKNLDWMSDQTKTKAIEKLNTVIMKVGYPDKWKDMSKLDISRKSYVTNVINSNKWMAQYMISKYGHPVDRTEWHMEPQTYNAYYNPSNNEIVVPGCNIIVPGFEHTMADDAILYSIIGGSTFGHEITHGFDDQGCKYDENGNLNNWWKPEDSVKFYARTKKIVKQFNNYIPVDSLHINGELTQGENIADLGGIIMGYEAFKKTRQFKDNIIVGGLTPDQRFFLGYAMAWMINERPETIANQIKSDEHSPAKFRVNGPLSNMPEFYKAFGIKEGDAMWLPDSLRVSIW